MRCPACGHQEDRVIDSRATREGRAIRRRRECLDCTHRFTTYEYVEVDTIVVVKKDHRREAFDRKKLVSGIARASEKRPISTGDIEELVDRVETDLQKLGPEITTRQIGERIMEELQRLDEVAYVRFASVYRHFKDVNQFMEEIQGLMKPSDEGK
ncbi:MAG: transcriptional regulator NrdR [Candidatus Eisenbacteria bacterium]|nr:transcriptional regulator NrdR [Candidatus Eisenbacteria bacterium]